MKILFVTNSLPSYPNNGAIIQTHHFMRILKQNHKIGLWSYSTEHKTPPDLGLFQGGLDYLHIEPKVASKSIIGRLRRWSRWISGIDPMARWSYDGSLVEASLREALKSFAPDVIMFEQLHMSYPIVKLQELTHRPVLAFNAHDAIHVVLERIYSQASESGLKNALNQRFLNVVKNFEHEVVKNADVAFSVSEVDAQHLRTPSEAKSWAITPNGVDVEYFKPLSEPPPETPLSMVFIGSLSYGPNLEAIQYYCEKIHPKLREKFPNCSLKIVGRPTAETQPFESIDGIEFVGFHSDFRPFFAQAHMSLVPLLSGSGTRFKILESWAMGKPMVSTSIGAEGLAFQHSENIWIADTADNFVSGIESLFLDRGLRERFATKGREVVMKNYSWDAIVETLEAKLTQAVDSQTSRA